MAELAEKYKIRVTWFYGVAGHGKGTVDAMSSFGCKKPLAQKIIGEDHWISSAKPMVTFLNEHFHDDPSKAHYFVDSEITAAKRRKFSSLPK